MKHPLALAGACFSAALLTACGASSGGLSPSATTPRSGFTIAAATTSLGDGTNLYVANGGGRVQPTPPPGNVTVYGLKRGKLLQTIASAVDRPSAIAFDSVRQHIIVASREPQHGNGFGTLAVFVPGSNKPVRLLRDTDNPEALAFDAAGILYVADEGAGHEGDGGFVAIYRQGGTMPSRIIPSGYYGGNYEMWAPKALALDPAGNLYVANGPMAVGSSDDVYAISVFAPGASIPTTAFQTNFPRVIAVSRGYLYVANAPPKKKKVQRSGSVTVYPLGRWFPASVITEGIHTPDALAFDAAGNLYVANLNGHDVTVYAPGGTSPIRTISSGVTSPRALAIGPEGNLYVANVYQSTISVYKPQQTTPFLTITQGLDAPSAMTLNAP